MMKSCLTPDEYQRGGRSQHKGRSRTRRAAPRAAPAGDPAGHEPEGVTIWSFLTFPIQLDTKAMVFIWIRWSSREPLQGHDTRAVYNT